MPAAVDRCPYCNELTPQWYARQPPPARPPLLRRIGRFVPALLVVVGAALSQFEGESSLVGPVLGAVGGIGLIFQALRFFAAAGG